MIKPKFSVQPQQVHNSLMSSRLLIPVIGFYLDLTLLLSVIKNI